MPSPPLQTDPRGLLQVTRHKSVPQGVVEGSEEARVLGLDQVKQPGGVLRTGREDEEGNIRRGRLCGMNGKRE